MAMAKGHIFPDGRSYETAHENSRLCLAEGGQCCSPAVGVVVFGPDCQGVPKMVPLAVCERHYQSFKLLEGEHGDRVIHNLARYHP